MIKIRDCLLLFLLISAPLSARMLPGDIEPGSSINDITLPLTAHTAAELAQVETGGKILSVEEVEKKDRIIFRVKVLHANGKVKIHRFDGKTGHAIH